MDSVSPEYRVCKRCGAPCKRSGKYYCSFECYWQDMRERDADKYIRQCETCGLIFDARDKGHYRGKRYCSNKCSAVARSVIAGPIPCLACGLTFLPQRKEQKYCSRTCKIAHMRQKRDERLAHLPMKQCETCGKLFREQEPGQRFCSRACVMRSSQVRAAVSAAAKRRIGTHSSAATRQKLSLIHKRRWQEASEGEQQATRDRARAYFMQSSPRYAKFLANQQPLPLDRFGEATCPTCGIAFLRKRRNQQYCSKPCGNQFIHTAEWIERQRIYHAQQKAKTQVSRQRQCLFCGERYIAKDSQNKGYCSRSCWLTDYYSRLATRHSSALEGRVHAVLRELGIPFETQHPISRFAGDLYFPSHHLIVEVQGCYWHGCAQCGFDNPEKQRQDRRRRACFHRAGYRVAELWEHDLTKDIIATVLALLIEQDIPF